MTLSDGAEVATDVALSATGLIPKTELATRAGIAINRGIVADRYLNTSAEDIFALGDCAEINGTLMPFVMPLMNQARALAKTLAGDRTAVVYPAMPVVVKTPSYPIVVAPPAPGSQGVWKHEPIAGGIRSLFVGANDSLLGFALGGAATAEKTVLSKTLPAPML
jgi:rubredoxin-NAD+ reductase